MQYFDQNMQKIGAKDDHFLRNVLSIGLCQELRMLLSLYFAHMLQL